MESTHQAEYAAFLLRNPLNYLRLALIRGLQQERHYLANPGRTAPGRFAVVEHLWLMTRDAWRKGGATGLLRKASLIPLHLRNAVRELGSRSIGDDRTGFSLPDDPEAPVRLLATPEYSSRLPRRPGLRIAILVWRFEIYGGVLAVTELANRLVLEGQSVMLMTLANEPAPGFFHLSPDRWCFDHGVPGGGGCRGRRGCRDILADCGRMVARHPADEPERARGLFCAGLRAWFLADDDSENRRRIVESYACADIRIVTSSWLAGMLAAHGHASVVVPMGIDTRVFYPQPAAASNGAVTRILVQARPHNPWRGFEGARQVLAELARRGRSFEAVFFGCDDAALQQCDLQFPYRNEGIVAARDTVAGLYFFLRSAVRSLALPSLRPPRPGSDGLRSADGIAVTGWDHGIRSRRCQHLARGAGRRTGCGRRH